MNFIFLPDIHFGPNKNNQLIQNALDTYVYPFICQTYPDMIVIGGDDTDDRLSLDQMASRYYLQFCNTITSFKKPNGDPIAVRWISGTESHQKGQLQSLQFLIQNPNADVKIYETVGEEYFNGCNILYVPEESVMDKKEYYKNTVYSGKKYDLCFGHGMFDHISGGWGDMEEKSLRSSPVWSYFDFKDIIKGAVFFGHIHKPSVFKNFIYYGGSLTRFCQGEDEPKGFLSIYYNKETSEISTQFIINELAPLYSTVTLTAKQYSMSADEIIDSLLKYKAAKNIFELRVMVDKDKLDLSKLQIIRKYFREHRDPQVRGIRIEIKGDKKNEDVNVGYGKSNNEINEQDYLKSMYPQIVDPTDWINNTIMYANLAYGKSVTDTDINEIVSKSIRYEKGEI